MRKFVAPVVLALSLAACTTAKPGSPPALDAAEIAKQADGVAAALQSLPQAPGDAKTQAQIANYAAWAAYLAKAAGVVIGAVGS